MYRLIAAAGDWGQSDQEVAAALGIPHAQARAARIALGDRGMIRDSAQHAPAAIGPGIVWVATTKHL